MVTRNLIGFIFARNRRHNNNLYIAVQRIKAITFNISGFCHGADEVFALPGCYTT
jgi:hypothetical protein